MLKKVFIAAVCLAAPFINCLGQSVDNSQPNGSVMPSSNRIIDEYIGVQVNQLIKQIINLNNSAAIISDPYLVTYSINLSKCGLGIQGGVGYNYQDITDKNTPTNRESKINELSYRLGICRKVMIGKRVQAGFGIDFVGAFMLDKTFNISVTNFGNGIDSTVTTTTSKTTTIGIGPQASLGIFLTKRLILGTEASYYFTWSKQKQNVQDIDKTTDTNTGLPVTLLTNSNTETDINSFSITLPVSIFLIVKF